MSDSLRDDNLLKSDGKLSIQETDQGIDHPQNLVPGASSNWIPPEDDSQQHKSGDLASDLVYISPSLNTTQLEVYKLAVSTLGVSLTLLEGCKDFKDVFKHLEHQTPTQAVSMTIISLSRLGVPKEYIDMLHVHIKEEFVMKGQYSTDMVLALGEILLRMSEEAYRNFMELAQRKFLRNYDSEKLRNPAYLIQLLMERDFLSQQYLKRYFQWVHQAGCGHQLKVLSCVCERQGIAEPDWFKDIRPHTYHGDPPPVPPSHSSTECSEQNRVQEPASLPPFVSLDGGGNKALVHMTNNATTAHTQRLSTTDARLFVSPNEEVEDPTSVKDTDRTEDPDTQWVLDPPQQQEEQNLGLQSSMVVATTQSISRGPPPLAAANERHVGERESTDLSDCTYGTMNIDPKSTAVNIDQKANLSQSSLTPPPTNNPQLQPPPVEQRKSCLKQLTGHKRSCCACLTISIVIIIALAVSFGIWVKYITKHDMLLSTPPIHTEHVGGNTTNKLGCYDPSFIKSLSIVESSRDKYSSKLFVVKQSKLQPNLPTHLMNVTFNVSGGRNIAVNRYGDHPVHVATHGELTYHITAIDHGPSPSPTTPSCGFQLFLFSSQENYNQFTYNSDDHTPAHSRNQSDCFIVTNNLTTSDFNFYLPDEGYYYAAAFVRAGVQLNVTIGGFLTSYNVSSLTGKEKCTLDQENTRCHIDINHGESVPGLSLEHVCVVSVSTVSDVNPVDITANSVGMNLASLLLLLSWSFLMLLLLGLAAIFACCVVVKRSRRCTNDGYQAILAT